MEKRDAFAFCSHTRGLIDESDAGGPAPVERSIEVVYCKADVMDARPAPSDELRDGRIVGAGFEQFHQRFAGGQAHNGSTVGVIKWNVGQSQDITVEGQQVVEGTYGDADVGNAGTAAKRFSHGKRVVNGSAQF